MENKICPRCKKNELNEVEVINALSRRDNKSYICSECGQEEAMFDYKRSQTEVSEVEIKEEKKWLEEK